MQEAISLVDVLRRVLPRFDAERAGEWLYGAPALSMFNFFRDEEMSLSRIYGDLLDPTGAHGQGALPGR